MFLKANKKIILLLVILLVLIAIIYLEKQRVAPEIKLAQKVTEFKDGKYPRAPELAGIAGYLNTKSGLTIESLKGKVVLVDFWTYTCINCIRTFPYLKDWYEKYSEKGFVIIGVHTPEFEFEKEYDNVKMAIQKYGIKYPVVKDNNYATWQAFRNRYWPRKYLIDTEGFIRYDHIGEGAYAETENKIQELLLEAGMNPEESPRVEVPAFSNLKQLVTTPELYTGYNFVLGRGQNVNQPGLKPEQITDYILPEQIIPNKIHLKGKWKSNSDNLEAFEDSAEIILDFTASEVNIVIGPLQKPQEIEIFIDDDSSLLLIKEPILYNVYKGEYTNSLLKIKVKKGFNFNAFTFG
ncbi:redoxin domain-containing protein [Candidatus Woesearchaeota archaeon]|nr:redoxin domain-containing protein [Candidatus Woesearchaeota archaeon]